MAREVVSGIFLLFFLVVCGFCFFFKSQNLFRNANPNVTVPLLQSKAALAVVVLSAYTFGKQVHQVLMAICDVGTTGEADKETE